MVSFSGKALAQDLEEFILDPIHLSDMLARFI